MTGPTTEKFERFKALHERPGIFVIPNPWNGGTARILEAMGFEALATTSAGYAFSAGRRDAEGAVSVTDLIENAREIVAATDLPVSADLEAGMGHTPESSAETIRAAAAVGLVGGSIEDATGDRDAPIFDFELARERIAAASEAARKLPFLLTARAENFLNGRPDLDDTIKRLNAFADAGADVLYAPALPDMEAIREVCRSVPKPVNVVMGLRPPRYSVAELQDAGVKRISVGGAFARAAFGAFMRAAEEVKTHGTFEFAVEAAPGAELQRLMRGAKRQP
jgi:2-methylisocitrate lyase-like PEP mutase family enzyme